jgi:NADH-quinone oxidoreductase subunit F
MTWLEKILVRIVEGEGRMEDLDLLDAVCGRIGGRVLCALADTGILPVRSAIHRFRDDFVAAIENGGDPRPEPMMEVPVGG